MVSLGLMIGSPVKNLVQMGKDVALDFVSADAKEKFDKAARDVIGAALFSTDIKTYSFYNDAENLEKASNLYQQGMALVNEHGLDVLTPAEQQQLKQLGEFVNSKAPSALNEAYQGGAGAVGLTTTILLGVAAVGAGATGKNGDDSTDGVNGDVSTGPYDPNRTRRDLEETYGADNVTSTTVPNNPHQRVNSNPDKGVEVIYGENGGKAVKITYADPKTGTEMQANIPYNDRGLPIFDDVAQYTTDIDKTKGRVAQMSQATKDLREGIKSGKIDPAQFTSEQLRDINAGLPKIKDLTWHHNADGNNMQLIPSKVHNAVSHVGQGSLGAEK